MFHASRSRLGRLSQMNYRESKKTCALAGWISKPA